MCEEERASTDLCEVTVWELFTWMPSLDARAVDEDADLVAVG